MANLDFLKFCRAKIVLKFDNLDKYAKEENRRMISAIGETCHLDFCCGHPRYIRYLGYIRGNIVQQCAKDAWMTHTQGGGRSREVGLGKARICGGFFANRHCDQMLRVHCSVNVTNCGGLCKCVNVTNVCFIECAALCIALAMKR